MLALTVNEACAEDPETASAAVPSVVLPTEKVTLPDTTADPLPGLTVASRTVLPVVSRLVEAAVKVIAVETGGEVTAIETEAVELAKFPVAV